MARLLGWAMALALVALNAQAAPTRTWTVVTLPLLTELGGSARAVNNRGDVAGTSEVVEHYPRPVMWSNGFVTDLLGENPTYGVANAINDQGAVAGTSRSGVVVWKDGVVTALQIAGEPLDINKSGAVVGFYYPCGEIACGPQHGFYWKDGVLFDIGNLGNTVTAANGLNDRGVVVGYSRLPFSSTNHAVVWEGGALRDLGTLGGEHSIAVDVNNHGVILGSADTPDGINHLVTWDVSGGPPRDLGARLSAQALNDRGAIVGNHLDTGMPFLLEDGQFTWLLDLPEMRAQGWTSFGPFDINDRGWIVGVGYRPGGPYAGTPIVLIPANGNGNAGGGRPKS